MIRLKLIRLDYSEDPEYGSGPSRKGLIWYDYGQPVGRVIIEECKQIGYEDGSSEWEWRPIDMIEVDPISEFKDKAKKLACNS
jgi:hypothetical protein